MSKVQVIGICGNASFEDIIKHFTGLGGDVVLMDPMMVGGKDHILSAVMHADRAFEQGTNRSKTILTETLLYAACERQIGKALKKMHPKEGCREMVAAIFNIEGDPQLERIGMKRCDDIIALTPNKIKLLGLDDYGTNVPYEDIILEKVSMVDLMKQ
ncbi:MAG: KEOPS complex subunit Cgi121 [Candidatus Methanomethylophilaceae archaeon]|nr:hypothetical protein [Candidatus Methanomethylophilaceae archaeon]MDY0225159.1 KEOPS complex subunit Cgi121 [Candidatus Methanomethylophilaceae archaeon]